MPTTILRERPPPARPSLRLVPRRTIITSGRAARHAGTKPKTAAAKRLEIIVKISTVESIRIVSRRGRCAGAMASSS